MNQVTSLAHQVNDILTRYIKIHDAIFRFSPLKFLLNVIFLGSPLKLLPIFKAMVNIDFCAHERELNALHSQLRVIQAMLDTPEPIPPSGTEFLTALGLLPQLFVKYTAALCDTVNRLHDICGHLCCKSAGAKDYSTTQYRTDMKAYNESVLPIQKFGQRLNALIASL